MSRVSRSSLAKHKYCTPRAVRSLRRAVTHVLGAQPMYTLADAQMHIKACSRVACCFRVARDVSTARSPVAARPALSHSYAGCGQLALAPGAGPHCLPQPPPDVWGSEYTLPACAPIRQCVGLLRPLCPPCGPPPPADRRLRKAACRRRARARRPAAAYSPHSYSYHSCRLRSSSAFPLLPGSAELSTPLAASDASSASANISATWRFVISGTP